MHTGHVALNQILGINTILRVYLWISYRGIQRICLCPNQTQTGFIELWLISEKKLFFTKMERHIWKIRCFDKFVLISLAVNICSVFGKMAEDRLTGLSRVCRAEEKRGRGCASCSFSAIASSGVQGRLWTCSIQSRTEKGVSGHQQTLRSTKHTLKSLAVLFLTGFPDKSSPELMSL